MVVFYLVPCLFVIYMFIAIIYPNVVFSGVDYFGSLDIKYEIDRFQVKKQHPLQFIQNKTKSSFK